METIIAEDPDYIFVTTMGDSQKAIDALKAGIESNPCLGQSVGGAERTLSDPAQGSVPLQAQCEMG